MRTARESPFFSAPETKRKSCPLRLQHSWKWIIRTLKWWRLTTARRTQRDKFSTHLPRRTNGSALCTWTGCPKAGWASRMDSRKPTKLRRASGCCSQTRMCASSPMGCAVAQDFVAVRWHAGVGNLVRGVTKNFFAGAGYDLRLVAFEVAVLLMTDILPFAGVFFGHGWIFGSSAIAVAIALGFHAGVAWVMRVSPLYALTHPLGALLFCYMLLRSTVVTLWQGGIVWRDTFYPLEVLKRGAV